MGFEWEIRVKGPKGWGILCKGVGLYLTNGGEALGFFLDPTQLELDLLSDLHLLPLNLFLLRPEGRQSGPRHLLIFLRQLAAEAQAPRVLHHQLVVLLLLLLLLPLHHVQAHPFPSSSSSSSKLFLQFLSLSLSLSLSLLSFLSLCFLLCLLFFFFAFSFWFVLSLFWAWNDDEAAVFCFLCCECASYVISWGVVCMGTGCPLFNAFRSVKPAHPTPVPPCGPDYNFDNYYKRLI